MSRDVTPTGAWLAGVALLFAGCGGGGGDSAPPATSNPPATPSNVVIVRTSVAAATQWTSDKIYVVEGLVRIAATLTIQPGTVVKFKNGAGMEVEATGVVKSNGTGPQPVVFTSYKDDTHGGDTNGDSAATRPVVGNWGGITLKSNDSSFTFTEFLYGGAGGTSATLDLTTMRAQVSNCVFAHNTGGDVQSVTSVIGALNARQAPVGTVIAGNTFYDNSVPLRISGKFSVDNSNNFRNPANNSETNLNNGIFLLGNSLLEITGTISYAELDAPLVLGGNVMVKPGAELSVLPGVVVKLFDLRTSLTAEGALKLNGSLLQPVVITSFKDDAHGGDTNGDGAASSPSVGDWGQVILKSSDSVFSRCEVLYGGRWGGGTSLRSTVEVGANRIRIENCQFVRNHGGEITSGSDVFGVVDASKALVNTVISANTFYENQIPLLISGRFSVDDSNVFHDPARPLVGNKYNGIFVTPISTQQIIGDVEWRETEVPFVITDSTAVGSGASLTLGDRVIVKAMTGLQTGIRISGALRNAQGPGVKFTSIKDDSDLRDTNGNGRLNDPALGDWRGLETCDSGNRCTAILLPNILFDSLSP